MEFKNIEVNNFGGIKHIVTTPKRVNVLIGPNGAGKSTFLKAVKFGLIGNQTRSQLVKDGESEADVKIVIDGYEVEKVVNDGGTTVYLNGKRTTLKSVVEILQNEYGATKDSMKFLTSSEVFEKASSSEFTEFLLESGIIPLKLDVNKFLSVCREEEIIPSDVENEIRALFPAAPEEFDLSLIGDKGDELATVIKSEKKEIARLESIVSQVAEVTPGSIRALEDIKKEYEAVIAEEAKANSYAEIVRRAEATKKRITELQAAYDRDTTVRPNPATKTAAESMMRDTKAAITKTTALVASFRENNKILSDQLTRLNSEKCPLSDKLICTQDKTQVKDEIMAVITSNDSQIVLLEMDLEDYEDQYKKAQDVLTAFNNNERAYQQKLGIMQQINSLKSAMPEIPPVVSSTSGLAERKRILNEELTYASQYYNTLKIKSELDKRKLKLEMHGTLARLTSKKGNVKAKILKMLLGTIVSSINDMAAKICPDLSFSLTINNSGNVLIQCTTPSGTQDYGDLSTGEKLLVQFLVMSQINLLSGFKILILDNLDKLDTGNFRSLLEFLQTPSVQDYFDHVFVATVDHEDFKNVLSGMTGINVISI